MKNRIEKYGFIEGVDFQSFNKIVERKIGATQRIEKYGFIENQDFEVFNKFVENTYFEYRQKRYLSILNTV